MEWNPPFTTGTYVQYHGHGTIENGRVKGLHPTNKDIVYVVYKCGGNWDFWMNYTGVLTETKYLTRGWREQ